MKKRLFSLILAALMLSSSLIACGESEVNSDTTPAAETDVSAEAAGDAGSETVTEELSDYEQRQLIPDNLPAETFDGADFRVMTVNNATYTTEITVDELNGDACNDAVYNRNITVEDRFGINILVEPHDEPHKQVNVFTTAGTDDAHIVGFYDYYSYVPITAGSLMNWIESPYQDLDQPWHNSLANDGAIYNNRLYAICSDLAITSMTYTYAIFANVDMLADYGYSAQDMYDLIKEGTWTLDKFIDITNGMYIDKNGDGTRDANDTYGFGCQPTNPADVWLTAFGEKVCELNETEVVLTFMSDKTVSILEKLVDWHYNAEGFYLCPSQWGEETSFQNGKLVFAPLRFNTAFSTLRTMDAVYTMLPYPKWDETQEGYYTNADDKFTAFGLPLTSANSLNFVSIIYEAMCAESYKQVYPAYYDQALKGKYSSDPTTAEMVDLIMAGRAFDFSFQFGESCFSRLCYKIRDMILAEDSNLASSYKQTEKSLKRQLDKVLNKAYGIE